MINIKCALTSIYSLRSIVKNTNNIDNPIKIKKKNKVTNTDLVLCIDYYKNINI